MHIVIAYLLGFTIEYLIIAAVFYNLVKRARNMMEKCYSAEEENRMKTRVLSSVSHEIRTPMHAILGMAEVAMREEMSPKLRKDIGIIRASAVGLLELIDGLLDYSRFEENMASEIIPEEAQKENVSDSELELWEPYHFTMDEAKNGLEAVTMAEKQQYDMIFMDSQMPVMSGGKACRKIRESECKTKCHTPVIAITADAIAGTREQLLAAGMDEYISKPVDSGKLATVIEQYL